MKRVDPSHQFLPEVRRDRVICGKTLVEWEYAVVYVHSKKAPFDPPTHLYFTFTAPGAALQTKVRFVDQWTYYRGRCIHPFGQESHEFKRARKMAIQVVATYRRNYIAKHGGPPNPLCLTGTLNPDVAKRETNRVNRRRQDWVTGQQSFDLKETEPRTE